MLADAARKYAESEVAVRQSDIEDRAGRLGVKVADVAAFNHRPLRYQPAAGCAGAGHYERCKQHECGSRAIELDHRRQPPDRG